MSNALLRYLLKDMQAVQGWFETSDALAISECLSLQNREGIAGAIAEIGVHHGKSFIALACAALPTDRLYAIDVFERQHLNLDQSGQGDREMFLANVERYAPQAKVSVLAMSSLDIRGREREFLEPLRFLSIDGGHTRDVTLNDLEIADAILVEGGMCCADDILHPEWTGVISGVFSFFERSKTLVPFALLPKKLYFCRPGYQERRRAQFREAFASSLLRPDKEFGRCIVDVYRNFA
jgi:predicted O-methyltransferase YrrM